MPELTDPVAFVRHLRFQAGRHALRQLQGFGELLPLAFSSQAPISRKEPLSKQNQRGEF